MTNQRLLIAPRRNWCFTYNNPPADGHTTFANSIQLACAQRFRYVVLQLEKSESGTLHYQGYLELRTAVRLSWLTKHLFQAHWSSRLGTRDQARNYCMKTDTREPDGGPWELGDYKSGGQGTRVDLAMVATSVKSGFSSKEIAEEYPAQWIKYNKGIKSLINILQPKRTVAPKVYICYGPTGTGKTKWAHDNYPKLYKKPCDTRWFDGYSGQKTLLLDDFSGAASKMSLNYVLQLLDRYPLQVEIKGDYMALLATTIIITTNIHPRLWYKYERRMSQYHALARRLANVLWFKKFGTPAVKVGHGLFFENYWEDAPEGEYLLAMPATPDATIICSDSEEEPQHECPETPTAHQPTMLYSSDEEDLNL